MRAKKQKQPSKKALKPIVEANKPIEQTLEQFFVPSYGAWLAPIVHE